MSRALVALLCAVSAVALAKDDDAGRARIFEKFDHGEHRAALERAGVSCAGCHQVGATAQPGAARKKLADTFLVPPDGACHQCHAPGEGNLGAGKGLVAAPHRCGTCHEERKRPDTHAPGWMEFHGPSAREGTATCWNCHARADCTDCHDRRSPAGQGVHDGSWLAVHGIAVFANPASCDTCHAPAECSSCHAAETGFGRSR